MSCESKSVWHSQSLDNVSEVAELVRGWYPYDGQPLVSETAQTTSSDLILPTTERKQLILPNGEVIHIEVDPPAETI